MSMIRKLTPVAIAIAALCSAPAFAGTTSATASNSQSTSANQPNTPYYPANTNSSNNAKLTNTVLQHASGNVGVNNAAGDTNQQANTTSIAASMYTDNNNNASATVENTQSQSQNSTNYLSNSNAENHAELDHHVLQDASGNIGVNNAAGDNNQQGNATAIATTNMEDSSTNATANVDSDQTMSNFVTTTNNSSNKAELEGHALENASGNVGVNNASGYNNQQANGLAVAKADDGVASATTDADQTDNVTAGYPSTSLTTNSSNSASLENDVLENASGNVHVNNAAGDNNEQGNFLAIAATDDSLATASAPSSQVAMSSTASMVGSSNNATMSNEVLQNASGNVGVNNSAGGNNQQLNSLAIATSNGD
ncbi:MAG: hypothetical protein ACYCQN_03880 [Acidiferrobacteraceae bacterium]